MIRISCRTTPEVLFHRNGQYESAIRDSDGRLANAGWTTFSYQLAMDYAEFTAQRNVNAKASNVQWPKRADPMEHDLPLME